MSLPQATFWHCVEVIERLGCDFVRTDHVQVSGRQRLLRRHDAMRRAGSSAQRVQA